MPFGDSANCGGNPTPQRIYDKTGVNLSICDSKIIQISFEAVLCCEAGVHQEAFFVIPFFETSVVEQLQVVLDHEGDDVILQALLEEDQSAYWKT